LKCGDVKEGFARVRCPNCKEEFFVAYSCRQRSCCPSCDRKRALLLGHRLKEEVFAPVPHRQWVFTIPKRLRIYFRYDRKLLGKLCRAAWETIRDVYALEVDGDCGMPAMIGAVQTFWDLINHHPHIHAVAPEGVFTESGYFVHIPYVCRLRATELWQEKVFALLMEEGRIDREVAAMIKSWKHTGFSVDNSVRIEAGDRDGMLRLIEYISRCPFSLARMISLTDNGKILYRGSKPGCIPFPEAGDPELDVGIPRHYEIYDPLDFLADVTQHIPNKGEHQIRYCGWYSNTRRGMNGKGGKSITRSSCSTYGPDDYWEKLEVDTVFRKKCRMTRAALIKCVYEADPLKCPKCGGTMKVISFIERHQSDVIEKILKHCGLWKKKLPKAPPRATPCLEPASGLTIDYEFFAQSIRTPIFILYSVLESAGSREFHAKIRSHVKHILKISA
jgi:hypothetical protein